MKIQSQGSRLLNLTNNFFFYIFFLKEIIQKYWSIAKAKANPEVDYVNCNERKVK